MSSKGRILIPGLYDTSDESENDSDNTPQVKGEAEEGATEQSDEAPKEDVSTQPEDNDVEEESCNDQDSEDEATDSHEVEGNGNAIDTEEVHPNGDESKEDEAEVKDNTMEETTIGVSTIATDDDEYDPESETVHWFVLDIQGRRMRMMPDGFDKKKYVGFETIPAETFTILSERYKPPNPEDDDYFFCELCVASFQISCPTHPLYRINDRLIMDANNQVIKTAIENRAKNTLPAFLEVKRSSIPDAGEGVFTTTDLPVGLVFGPYQGIYTSETNNKGYAWEIRIVGKPSMYIDGCDPNFSNWMRYINSPRHDKEQNLIAYQHNGSVFYRVYRPVDAGSELLVWYGKQFGEDLGVMTTKSPGKNRREVKPVEKNPFIL